MVHSKPRRPTKVRKVRRRHDSVALRIQSVRSVRLVVARAVTERDGAHCDASAAPHMARGPMPAQFLHRSEYGMTVKGKTGPAPELAT